MLMVSKYNKILEKHSIAKLQNDCINSLFGVHARESCMYIYTHTHTRYIYVYIYIY